MEVDQSEQEKRRRGRPNKSNTNPRNTTTATTNNNNSADQKTRALDDIEDSAFAAQAEESTSRGCGGSGQVAEEPTATSKCEISLGRRRRRKSNDPKRSPLV